MTRVSLGVIGVGRIGKMHGENIALRVAGAELAAIADVNLAAAEQTAARLNVPVAVADYRRLLDDPAVEGVVICSATNTHAEIILAAAANGKHIFCEKPIDFDLARIDEALSAVERARVKLQVGYNRRFDPNFRKVREMVAAGKVGVPHLLRITSRDPAPPPLDYIRVSGGLFLDMTIHDFDMARYVMGSEVTEVFAAGGVLVEPAIGAAGDVDTAVTTLRFASGAIGAIDNSRRAVYGYDQRLEVFGPEGMVTVANNVPDTAVYSHAGGVESARPPYFFLERYTASYVAELGAFAASIRDDTPPPVTGLDGWQSVLIALAAQKSAAENRAVRLSELDP